MSYSALRPFFPPALPENGRIGVVAPGCWPEEPYLDAMRHHLEKSGYDVVVHAQVRARHGQLAGSDKERAAGLHDMFVDPSIGAVFCARGGAGANLILDHLDFDLIQKNPKPFVGFSDITVLLNAISARTGLVTYHGPVGWNFTDKVYRQETQDDLLRALRSSDQPCAFVYEGLDVAREGKATGRLYGGCLTLLQALIGTAYDWPVDGAILFFEEVGEDLYKIERMLCHMRQAGKFETLAGVIVGQMTDVPDDDPAKAEPIPYGQTLKEIVLRHVPQNVPIVFDFPCGHRPYITTLPVGADIELILSGKEAKIIVNP